MSKTFELVPMTEKPEVFGAYICMNRDQTDIDTYWYDMDGWSIKEGEPPELWLRPICNANYGGHSFVQYNPDIIFQDGVYNGRYNKEPAVIRIKGGRPVYVSFIGFLNVDGESRPSSIFDPRGILASNVELLLKSQIISEGCLMHF